MKMILFVRTVAVQTMTASVEGPLPKSMVRLLVRLWECNLWRRPEVPCPVIVEKKKKKERKKQKKERHR